MWPVRSLRSVKLVRSSCVIARRYLNTNSALVELGCVWSLQARTVERVNVIGSTRATLNCRCAWVFSASWDGALRVEAVCDRVSSNGLVWSNAHELCAQGATLGARKRGEFAQEGVEHRNVQED